MLLLWVEEGQLDRITTFNSFYANTKWRSINIENCFAWQHTRRETFKKLGCYKNQRPDLVLQKLAASWNFLKVPKNISHEIYLYQVKTSVSILGVNSLIFVFGKLFINTFASWGSVTLHPFGLPVYIICSYPSLAVEG